MATALVPLRLHTDAARIYTTSTPQDQQNMGEVVSSIIVSFPGMGSNRMRNKALYEQDFFEWTETTANLVRAGRWYEVDVQTLVEEITSLGISQKHALGSHLKNLVMHLLKWYYQPSGRQTGYSWSSSIINARDDIATILEDSPSLRREVPALLTRRYPAARRLAQNETNLPLATFPPQCPWTVEQILADDFWPEATP